MLGVFAQSQPYAPKLGEASSAMQNRMLGPRGLIGRDDSRCRNRKREAG